MKKLFMKIDAIIQDSGHSLYGFQPVNLLTKFHLSKVSEEKPSVDIKTGNIS